MTVVAWDGKVLAADKRGLLSDCAWPVTKIHRVGLDAFACIVGPVDQGMETLAWYRSGADPAAFPASRRTDNWSPFTVIHRDGRISRYEQTPYPVEYHTERYADGSGRAYAIAAMECGRSAVEAVEIACRYDPNCGNGVDVLAFEP